MPPLGQFDHLFAAAGPWADPSRRRRPQNERPGGLVGHGREASEPSVVSGSTDRGSIGSRGLCTAEGRLEHESVRRVLRRALWRPLNLDRLTRVPTREEITRRALRASRAVLKTRLGRVFGGRGTCRQRPRSLLGERLPCPIHRSTGSEGRSDPFEVERRDQRRVKANRLLPGFGVGPLQTLRLEGAAASVPPFGVGPAPGRPSSVACCPVSGAAAWK